MDFFANMAGRILEREVVEEIMQLTDTVFQCESQSFSKKPSWVLGY